MQEPLMNHIIDNSHSFDTTLRFILDGKVIDLHYVDPTRTVLQHLREDRHRTGTKEGCAEGDCGACTVIVGVLKKGRLQLRAVNACILFLPTLDGKILFTIESIKHYSKASLHPAQQSMVDCHGSQCGFCTPGFIMSMVALYKRSAQPSQVDIADSLSGNLCRCTGYKPIIEAAQEMYNQSSKQDDGSLLHQVAGSRADDEETALIELLNSIRRQKMLVLQGDGRRYIAPTDLQQFAKVYADNPGSTILAGGTDIGIWVTKQQRQLETLIYLGNIDELRQISNHGNVIEIGSAVSLTDAFESLEKEYPELSELFRRFASMPIRNSGTLGGNIANGSPIGDSMPVLITLGSTIVLHCGENRRTLPLKDLYIDYQKNALQSGEFIESIRVPKKQSGWQVRSYKIAKRYDQDISAVCAAFNIQLIDDQVTDIRIAFGGMASTPKRAFQTEKALLNKTWDSAQVKIALKLLEKDYSPLSDMRASANYRMKVAQNTLYRFYLETRSEKPLNSSQVNVFEAV